MSWWVGQKLGIRILGLGAGLSAEFWVRSYFFIKKIDTGCSILVEKIMARHVLPLHAMILLVQMALVHYYF